MADFSLNDIVESAGNVSANFAIRTANKAANFVCGLYKDFPGAIIETPISAFQKGFWDTLCSGQSPGLPDPPSSPFVGGQCSCGIYDVPVIFDLVSGANPEQVGARCWGAIGGARIVFATPNGDAVQILCQGLYYNEPCQPSLVWRTVYNRGQGNDNVLKNARITTVVRVDGNPDDCGDPPPQYPPVVIPPSRLTINEIIQYNDGTDITVPIVYAPVSFSAPVTVDVGGVSLNFDFGGVTIGDSGNQPPDLAEILQRLNDIDILLDTVKDTGDNIYKDTKKIQQDVDKPPPVPNSEDYDVDIKDEFDDKEESNIENLAYVKIELINIPKNAKNQSGNDAPDVYYAGWFEFTTGDYAYPREPIHFQSGIFEAPSGSDGYAYTLYAGYTGRAIVVTQKPPV